MRVFIRASGCFKELLSPFPVVKVRTVSIYKRLSCLCRPWCQSRGDANRFGLLPGPDWLDEDICVAGRGHLAERDDLVFCRGQVPATLNLDPVHGILAPII